MNPFQLLLHFTPSDRSLLFFLRKAFFLRLEPFGVIALEWIALAPVHFENPASNIVQKVAVVRNGDDCAGIIFQMAFKPRDRFRVKVVRRFIKQKNVGLLKKQPAKRDPATLSPGKHINDLVSGRTAKCVHRKFQIRVQIPCVGGIKFFLQFGLSRTEFVKISVGVSERLVHFVEFFEQIGYWLHAFLHDFKNRFPRCKIRLLFKIPHRIAVKQFCFASIILVDARKNLEER